MTDPTSPAKPMTRSSGCCMPGFACVFWILSSLVEVLPSPQGRVYSPYTWSGGFPTEVSRYIYHGCQGIVKRIYWRTNSDSWYGLLVSVLMTAVSAAGCEHMSYQRLEAFSGRLSKAIHRNMIPFSFPCCHFSSSDKRFGVWVKLSRFQKLSDGL